MAGWANRGEPSHRRRMGSEQFFNCSYAIGEAQKCARMLLEQTGQRSAWCVVTRKGFWPASYFFAGDEGLLQTKLSQGHVVVLAFAATRRLALAACSGYQAVDPECAEEPLRRFSRYAMRRAA